MVRYKNRYFVTEIEVKDRPSHAPFPVSKHSLQTTILNKIHEIHGDFGLASVSAGFRIKYCNPYTKIVLIRSRHGPHRFVGTVLPLIKFVEKVNVQFNILYLGGTMIKCFKFVRIISPVTQYAFQGLFFLVLWIITLQLIPEWRTNCLAFISLEIVKWFHRKNSVNS